MNKNEAKIGDIVMLKSGGPNMTIYRFPMNDGYIVECKWFNDKNELQQDGFYHFEIEKVEMKT